MRHYLPQISWHDRDVIYAADFQRTDDESSYVMLTAGMQLEMRKWEIKFDESQSLEVNYVCTIRGHQEPINVARFSPDGRYIASGENKGQTYIWERVDTDAPDIFAEPRDENFIPDKETWQKVRTFRDQHDDISDLAWAADSITLYSVSVDCSCAIHNVQTGQRLKLIVDHAQFVNGICVDPKSRMFATLSNDRSMRVYANEHPKYKALKKVQRAKVEIPVDYDGPEAGTQMDLKLFHDDQLNSFVRRPAFSPCGELLVTPAGNLDIGARSLNCTYVFTRRQFDTPSVILPCPDSPTIAVSFSPVLYELQPDIGMNVTGLPYRCIFAVLSLHSLAVYDSQQVVPFVFVTNIHYAALTDVTWSKDGLLIVVSSQDGYNSFLRFEPTELGRRLNTPPTPPATPPPIVTPKAPKRPKTPVNKPKTDDGEQSDNTTPVTTPCHGTNGTPSSTASASRKPAGPKTPSSKNILACFAAAAAKPRTPKESAVTGTKEVSDTDVITLDEEPQKTQRPVAHAIPKICQSPLADTPAKKPRRISLVTMDNFMNNSNNNSNNNHNNSNNNNNSSNNNSNNTVKAPESSSSDSDVVMFDAEPAKECTTGKSETTTTMVEQPGKAVAQQLPTATSPSAAEPLSADEKKPRRVAFVTMNQ